MGLVAFWEVDCGGFDLGFLRGFWFFCGVGESGSSVMIAIVDE